MTNITPVSTKVISCVKGCLTPHQVETCMSWAMDLAKRGYLTEQEFKEISKYIYRKGRIVYGSVYQGIME